MATEKLHSRAEEAIRKRNYAYAIELYQQVLAIDPDDTKARKDVRATVLKNCQETGAVNGGPMAFVKGLAPLLKTQFFGLRKKYVEQSVAAEQFLVLAPQNKFMLEALGKALYQGGHYKGAVEALEWLLGLDPNRISALKLMARSQREAGNLNAAMRYFERVAKLLPSDAEATKAVRDLAAQGANIEIEDRTEKGEGSYRDLIKDKEQAKKLEKAQHMLRTDEDFEQAIAAAQEKIREEPAESKHHRALAEIHAKRGDFDAAIKSYQEALEIDSSDIYAKDGYGDVMLEKLEAAARAAKGGGDQEALRTAMAEKIKFGVQEFRRRVQAHPTNLDHKYQLGLFYMQSKKYDDAIGMFQQAVKNPKRRIEVRQRLGKCFLKKGNFDLAVKEFEHAREGLARMTPQKKDITYELGLAYEEMGNAGAALTEYERIYEVDIKFKDVAERIDGLKAKLG